MRVFTVETASPFGSGITEWLANSGHTIHCCSMHHDIDKFKQSMVGLSSLHNFEMVILPAKIEMQPKRKGDLNHDIDALHMDTCRAICNHFSSIKQKPQALLCPSSITIYTSDNQPVTEQSTLGTSPESKSFVNLEKLVSTICEGRLRAIILRTGEILNRKSKPWTASAKFLINTLVTYRGDRKRLVSWVSREDMVRATSFILNDSTLTGPVNIVSGDQLSRYDLLSLLARKFTMKTTLPLPYSMRKILLADNEAAPYLNNIIAVPIILHEKGFLFDHISFEEYLFQ